jgi:RNA polymerase sigma-70 factor (ECF subfamily)
VGDPDERALLARLRRGDDAALSALVRRYQDVVYRVACRVTDAEAAADAAQEAFVTLWERPRAFTGGSLRAWLCAVARNAALNARRSAGRRQAREKQRGREAAGEVSPQAHAEEREELARVRAFVEGLPDMEREAMLLFAVEGLGYKDVARVLETTPATAKQAVFRARSKLRERFPGA